MGTYCDGCFLFSGGIGNNSLKQIAPHDFCEECFKSTWQVILAHIKTIPKRNSVTAFKPEPEKKVKKKDD